MKLIKKCFILLMFVLLTGCAVKVTFKQDCNEVLASQENKKIYSKKEIQKRTKETMKYESGERVIFCAEVYKYKKKADIQGFDILVDSYGLTKIRNIRRIEEYEKRLQDAI